MGEKKWELHYYYDDEGNYIEQWLEYYTYYDEGIKAWCCKKIGEGEKKIVNKAGQNGKPRT